MIQPEKEMGIKSGLMIMSPNIRDLIQLDDRYAIVEIATPSLWQNHSLEELRLRAKYGINVIGLRENEHSNLNMMIDASEPLSPGTILVMIVERKKFDKLKLE